MSSTATGQSPAVEVAVDPQAAPVHWPDFWDELADRWAQVQAVLAEEVEEVDADAPAS